MFSTQWKHVSGRFSTVWKRVEPVGGGMKEATKKRVWWVVAHGCGGGCLGCLGMLVLALVFGWAALWLPVKCYEKWSGIPEAMDSLKPGMSEEEARAVFPGHCLFEVEEIDHFFGRTWVANQDAVPSRVLKARAPEPTSKWLMWGFFVSHFDAGADVFFDAEGRLVGVHENAWEDGHWVAKWGEVYNEKRETGGE